MAKILVVIKNVNEPAVIAKIEDTLEASQEIVGGYIEAVSLYSFSQQVNFLKFRNLDQYNICFMVNEEGLLQNLQPNWMYFVGNIFVTKTNEDGEPISLTEDEALTISEAINYVGR
jgi:hypothetical protein